MRALDNSVACWLVELSIGQHRGLMTGSLAAQELGYSLPHLEISIAVYDELAADLLLFPFLRSGI